MNVEADQPLRHDEDDDPDMPELIGRCDSDSDESDNDDDDDEDSIITQEEDDYQDLPDLVPRYDEDSDDEDLIITHSESYEQVNYSEYTATDVTPTEETRKETQKSAPNRLLNIKKMKKVIDSNLTVCPICETNGRELCDGDSIGLQMEVLVRCTGCARVEEKLKKEMFYLKRQHKESASSRFFMLTFQIKYFLCQLLFHPCTTGTSY